MVTATRFAATRSGGVPVCLAERFPNWVAGFQAGDRGQGPLT